MTLGLIPLTEAKGLLRQALDEQLPACYGLIDSQAREMLMAEGVVQVDGIRLWSELAEAEAEAALYNGVSLLCFEPDPARCAPIGDCQTLAESLRRHRSIGFSGLLAAEAMEMPEIADGGELLAEGRRASAASSHRLKRIVLDRLNKSRKFRKLAKRIKIVGDRMEVQAGGERHTFEVRRTADGWVTDVKHVKGDKRKLAAVARHVRESFKGAHFQQVLEDACSGDRLRLVMLDYTRLDGGRRTRLVEAYSYRFRPSTGRTYFYGWNVEEGGIRSYIVPQIHGARITDKTFEPRYLVEIGQNKTTGGPLVVDRELEPVVTDAVIRRSHQRFELAGGRGKIIKRLGHSVERRKR